METFFQNEVFSRTILIKENGCTQNNDTEPATQSLILSLSLNKVLSLRIFSTLSHQTKCIFYLYILLMQSKKMNLKLNF